MGGLKITYNKTITVSEYLNQWLTDYCVPRLARNSVTTYRINIDKHITPYIGDIKLCKLQPEKIQALYAQLHSCGMSNTSVVFIHSTLRRALNCAIKQRILKDNPMNYIYPPHKDVYKPIVIGGDDIVKLLSVCRGSDIYIAVLLASCLGLRRGEVLGLKWCDIDFTLGTLEVRHTATIRNKVVYLSSPKTASSKRTILLASALLSELLEHKRTQPLNPSGFVVCRADGSVMTVTMLIASYKVALKNAGLPEIRFHDLRHSNATLMLRNNVPAKIVQSILGHAKIATTLDLYSHVMLDMQAPAVNVIQNLLY